MAVKNSSMLRITILISLFLAIFGNMSFLRADNLHTVKLSLLPYISNAPIFIAIEEGFFKEQGLRIELKNIRSQTHSVPALARGDLDVGAHTVGANIFAAVAKGLNIKIVAGKSRIPKKSDVKCNFAAIILRKDLFDSGEVRSIEKLKGKKVALGQLSNLGYIYESIFSSNNLTVDDLNLVKLPFSARLQALEKKTIDALMAGEPFISQSESLGYTIRLAKFEDYVPNYQIACIFFSPNLTVRNPEIGKKFMIGYLKGIKQYNRGKTNRNLAIYKKYTKQDLDILKRMCLPYIDTNGYFNSESILTVQDWAFKKGYIDSKASKDQLFDTRFIDYANNVLKEKQ